MSGRERLVKMNSCVFTLVWGSLLILSGFASGACDKYVNITDTWRNKYFTSASFTGYPNDDAHLVGKWLRFTGIGGDRIITSCSTGPIGGTQYPIHVSIEYPTNVSGTPTKWNASGDVLGCDAFVFEISVILCPGGFYIYQSDSHPHGNMGYVTYHYECNTDSCGPLGNCSEGGCRCVSGYEIPSGHLPSTDSYGCVDIDECQKTAENCGPDSTCNNTIGSYICNCLNGFQATDPALSPVNTNPCKDIDECLGNICGDNGNCTNNQGSFLCTCHPGYQVVANATPICQDIDECLDTKICGPKSVCINKPGFYTCSCKVGYAAIIRTQEPSKTNICIDIDECLELTMVCGPNANCTNSIGSYFCTCHSGYRLTNAGIIASVTNPCIDIDECKETPEICGDHTVCTNVLGAFDCSCIEGYFPSTGIIWKINISYCINIQVIMAELDVPEGQSKEKVFLDQISDQLMHHEDVNLPDATVVNGLSASMEVSGVGPRARSKTVSSEGNAEIGSLILGVSGRLVTAMVKPGQKRNETSVKSTTVDLMLQTLGPGDSIKESTRLSANGHTMQINLESLAKNNNDSAAAAFFTLHGMESLLSHQYFVTENRTEMYSDVITALLPLMSNTNLTEPVNFTIHHKKQEVTKSGLVTCVYWEDKTEEVDQGSAEKGGKTTRWSVNGCSATFTNENYTVCSCSHLSTFALILQISEPPPSDPFLEWLNRVCVIIGLFFFGLAILTFLLCSWNPKINNTARLHLCLSLALSHLLLLWNDRYVDHELACTVMAGLLHFLVVASFVWMLLEAFQLYLLVRRLSKVQVIQRDGLPKPLLYIIGYGVPFVIVGVSALVYSDGYGATEADTCWLSQKRNFKWSLTGPVISILGLNCILFFATLWSLRPTLANMKSDISQSKDTRLIVFKILAQFVILGCTWILGLYQTNLFFQVLFILLNSQQGTFLYIVHCVLNKEVREEYIKWLTCSFNKPSPEGESVKDVPSVSEDMDKAEE